LENPPAAAPGQGCRVTVVVPALNEAENLPHVLPHIPSSVYEVVLVDGGSTDGTVDVARGLRPDVKVVAPKRFGKGAALLAGFEAATGDLVITLDADGSMDPAEIDRFVEALLAGADYAKGSRYLPGGGSDDISFIRGLGNACLVRLVRLLFGCRFTDLCYGYNAVWKHALPAMALDCDGFEIETLMNIRAIRAGLVVAEVPSYEHPRIFGTSRLNAVRDGWRVLRTILRERLRGGARQPNGTAAKASPVVVGTGRASGKT
jgi:glycosyltransferase involved in cell wall biosynthesis